MIIRMGVCITRTYAQGELQAGMQSYFAKFLRRQARGEATMNRNAGEVHEIHALIAISPYLPTTQHKPLF